VLHSVRNVAIVKADECQNEAEGAEQAHHGEPEENTQIYLHVRIDRREDRVGVVLVTHFDRHVIESELVLSTPIVEFRHRHRLVIGDAAIQKAASRDLHVFDDLRLSGRLIPQIL